MVVANLVMRVGQRYEDVDAIIIVIIVRTNNATTIANDDAMSDDVEGNRTMDRSLLLFVRFDDSDVDERRVRSPHLSSMDAPEMAAGRRMRR